MSNARRQRKKERRKLNVNDFLPDMEPDGEYYSCSNQQTHAENCHEIPEGHQARDFGYTRLFKKNNQEFGCLVVTKWDVGIFFVNQRMKELEINSPITLDVDIKVQVILEILAESGIASPEEQNEKYQVLKYKTLKNALDAMEPQALELKRQRLIATPDQVPKGPFHPGRN